MNIAFRYGQEYRNVTQNKIFSEFTGRKLPFAKYAFSPLCFHTHQTKFIHPKKAKKTFHMGVFFCFYCVSRKNLYFKVIGDNVYP